MIKKKQNTIDLGLLKDIFHVGYTRWVFGVSTGIIGCICLYFLSIPELKILPGINDYKFVFYTDSSNGGSSQISKQLITDSTIYVEFVLKEGFVSPYVGLSMSPQKDSVINLTYYNQLHLEIAGKGINSLDVSLFNQNPLKKINTGSAELGFHTNFEISTERNQYYINLNQLVIPEWLREQNNISHNEEVKPDLKHILNVNIGTAYTPMLETKLSLTIYSISFERNNKNLILLLIAAEIVVVFLLVIIHYFRAFSGRKTLPVTIAYKPVDVENETQQLKSFLTYINTNFQDNSLTLEQVSKYTGINQRRITNSIQQTFGCNFKTYVNRLRINEAKRLLLETELNVGEIAFKVGFINQSHFNRVFKNLEGVSPSGFRENKK